METIGLRAGSKRKVLTPRRLTKKSQRVQPKDQGNLLDISLLGRSLHCPTIWWCAEKIYPGKRFDKYAILGDDICIADSKVAKVYLSTLKDLVDLSPLFETWLIPIQYMHGLYSLCHLYKIQRFSTLCRLYGIGYRLLGKLNHTKSSTVLRLKEIWLKAKLSFELWLGQCCPVDPYLKGRLIWKLQQAFRPKDLVVPPTSTYKSETF
ncbi:unnamed protein product [Vicia faba]|uniref:Uncharacterized protein n=1 Tax=Vicia faba TaxID=3906 RepID=A0AAV0ZVN7_VICFA|nr:unnamed protein product [Vicia faba]